MSPIHLPARCFRHTTSANRFPHTPTGPQTRVPSHQGTLLDIQRTVARYCPSPRFWTHVELQRTNRLDVPSRFHSGGVKSAASDEREQALEGRITAICWHTSIRNWRWRCRNACSPLTVLTCPVPIARPVSAISSVPDTGQTILTHSQREDKSIRQASDQGSSCSVVVSNVWTRQ